jgi:hypothetical protein
MKLTMSHALVSAVAFFGLCASVDACSPNGGGQPATCQTNAFPSYPTYPMPYSAPVGPVTSNFTGPVTPSAPQARLTVLPTTDAPVGKLQVASPAATGSDAKGTTNALPSNENNALDATASAKDTTSKIADAIKGLVGTWMAVSRHGDGELSTIELQLDDHGWAKLTIPGADGKPSTTTRKVEFENSELKLTGGDADVTLGKLVTFNSRQMVLERSSGQVTFVRP